MEILITGCERSGTKMFSKKLSEELNVNFNLENKHTIASFKYYKELQKWVKYSGDTTPLISIGKYEKHTLNNEINIDFLKWINKNYPNLKIYYMIRDGRNVVSSIINKTWGHSQTVPNYRISLADACNQWNNVIDTTWNWAQENCEIVRYEEICDIVSNPLNKTQLNIVNNLLSNNLKKTNYI